MTNDPISFEISCSPSEADHDLILKGLMNFNASEVGPSNELPLAILVRHAEFGDEVVGGLSGYTAWGWLFIENLWLPETLRGRGLAARLLADAEAQARLRGCHAAWLDTFNPYALKLYRSQGYVVFGELPEFPKGRSRFFLKKSLL
ncbi:MULTISPECIES: GNAT family N-acetyltransferase [unclassified Pseudomonas]|uniref:GNAT family N-acetyltransferase n=1 Tax=unclassified Pseudomonas TaxID=196821 RepID=UPI0025D55F4F|nr:MULTISPECIES: GNAT family N-acetyltransferase [unclassified Pseudomonas]